jgi:hypothetical protein
MVSAVVLGVFVLPAAAAILDGWTSTTSYFVWLPPIYKPIPFLGGME